MWSSWSHGRRVAALSVVGTAIALPLVIWVLGPNMPPGHRSDAALRDLGLRIEIRDYPRGLGADLSVKIGELI